MRKPPPSKKAAGFQTADRGKAGMTKSGHPSDWTSSAKKASAPLVRSPRRRSANETSETILIAAAAEFGANGYEAASIHGIESRSGFSRAALYYYFPSKKGLYRILLRGLLQTLEGVTTPVLRSDRPALRKIEDLFLQISRLRKTNPLFGRVLLGGQSEREDGASVTKAELVAEITRAFTTLVTEGQRAGLLRKASPEDCSLVLLGLLLVQRPPMGRAKEPEEALTRTLRLVLDGLRDGGAPNLEENL